MYHGLPAFDREKGAGEAGTQGFSHAFGETMCALASANEKICAVTAAMEAGTGLSEFREKFRSRFFDVGIAEEHAVTFCAGLARGGMIPVFAVYSTFLQRAYDQLIHDAALQKLKVILAIDRAGVVGEDGRTHQGVFDVAFLHTIPGIHVYAPTYYDELSDNLSDCVEGESRLYAVRYPRGKALYRPAGYKLSGRPFGVYGSTESQVAVVTYGRLFSFAYEAMQTLAASGIKCKVIKLNRIIPLDPEVLQILTGCKTVFFFEEGIRAGGVAECLCGALAEAGFSGRYVMRCIEDGFIRHAPMFRILERLGLDQAAAPHAYHIAVHLFRPAQCLVHLLARHIAVDVVERRYIHALDVHPPGVHHAHIRPCPRGRAVVLHARDAADTDAQMPLLQKLPVLIEPQHHLF